MMTGHPPVAPVAAAEPVPPRLLLVESQPAARARLQCAMRSVAHVVTRTDFPTARKWLENGPGRPDFLVTNLRLGLYNGLHLVYLVAARGIRAWSIVYTEQLDVGLAKEIHHAGAFYDIRERLVVTVNAYVRGILPLRDRRERFLEDRRTMFRGGRRCWDHHLAAQAPPASSRMSSSNDRRQSHTGHGPAQSPPSETSET